MKLKTILLAVATFAFASCAAQKQVEVTDLMPNIKEGVEKIEAARIPVLNFGTFHMGSTSDATSTEFDPHDEKNIADVHEVAAMLAEFKPTVILIENEPKRDEENQAEFAAYKQNPEMKFEYSDEINLLAFEVGRLAGTERIYGIDHKMGYDYGTAYQVAMEEENKTYLSYMGNLDVFMSDFDKLSLLDKLKVNNTDANLNMLIELNAEIMSHVGTEEDPYLGADQAAELYKRNIRMYANMNEIELDENDRVFILMGATHTAYFRDFISRSPKYKMVNTFEYLK